MNIQLALAELTDSQKAFLQALSEHDFAMDGGQMTLPGGRVVSDTELVDLLVQIRRGDDAETIRAEVERIASDFGHHGDEDRTHGDVDKLMTRAMTAVARWARSNAPDALVELDRIAEAALTTDEINCARHTA
jgi:hypothetical protein